MKIRSEHLVLLAVVAPFASAARTIEIVNECDFSVWPAVSAFSGNEEAYTDEPGWEAKPGSKKAITVPSTWMGRIWGRRACVTDTSGKLVCVAGGCDNGLDCGEAVLAEATALELRLQSSTNGQYDVIDLQNGGGWSIPTKVSPEATKCAEIECTPDLEGCPKEEMQLKDSYGVILGCASACFAGVGEAEIQCCMGDHQTSDTCTSDMIFAYDYFKAPCKNSYAYFQDRKATTVDILCPAEGDPGFTLTFCYDGNGLVGDGGSTGSSGGSSTKTKSGESGAATGEEGVPTGTAASKPSDIPALSSAAAPQNITSATGSATASGSASASGHASAASTGATASSTKGAGTSDDADEDDSTATGTATAASSSSSGSDWTSGEVLGMSTPIFAAVVGGVAVVGILAVVGVCLCMRKKGTSPAAGRQAVSDDAVSAAGPGMGQSQASNNPGQSYSLGRKRSSGRRALLAQHESSDSEASSSAFSEEEDEKPARRASQRSRR
ncbi:hypothetical protein JCM10212_006991 [Sporobolomyces blumeae]